MLLQYYYLLCDVYCLCESILVLIAYDPYSLWQGSISLAWLTLVQHWNSVIWQI